MIRSVGIRNALKLQAASNVIPFPVAQIASPFVPYPSHLQAIVWADIFGADAMLTRDTAMRVPAVARARHLICPTIASFPLKAFRLRAELDPGPSWITNAGAMSPWHRMLWTVDDLIFGGWSLWAVTRGADNFPVSAERVPTELWQFAADGRGIEIADGPDSIMRPAGASEVVLIPGPHEGIITFGGDAIRQASALADRTKQAAEQPHAQVELHYTGDAELTQPQIDALVENYARARRGEFGGVGFTNKWTELKEHGAAAEHLLVEGRNAAAVEVARTVGIPASMIDAVTASAGLEYNTGETRNAQFIDYGLNAYMGAITARLSMDDVVPRGQSVRMDTAEWRNSLPTPTGPVTED